MSRRIIEYNTHFAVVGHDRPLGQFFIDVYDKTNEDVPEEEAWVTTEDGVTELLEAWGLPVPDTLLQDLKEDCKIETILGRSLAPRSPLVYDMRPQHKTILAKTRHALIETIKDATDGEVVEWAKLIL